MAKYKIKKGDMVLITTGDDKGKTAKISRVLPKKGQVVVEGCNLVKKAIKANDKNPKGGFVSKEMPIHISNVKKVEGDN